MHEEEDLDGPGGHMVVQLPGLFNGFYTERLVHVGSKEPGLVRRPGKIGHLELTGMSDGHAETSEGGVE